ncbi:hypothetical protein [Nocardioides sp.]|uniref:hypothetical protein n=1 Tax=Nocardioides sp. TaxID=35761 RepID=UPI0019999E4C|nr:hypothetical protein [Nocardioides sp.]MBC7276134.1 hypothetical protein [Nocardioides sp.]
MFWAWCRWWFFGVVLGVVIGGGVGSALAPIFGTLAGAWYGGMVGAVVGLIESVLVAPAVLLPSSPAVDRIWSGLVGIGVTFALGFAMFNADDEPGAGGESIEVLVAIAALSGVLAAWFGEAVTRGVRIPLPHMVIGEVALGMVCGVGCAVVGLSDTGASEPGVVAGVMLLGLACGGILGSVLIVFNLLVAAEPAAE